MFTRPVGVQQLVSTGGPLYPVPVLTANWKYFCLKTQAESLCNTINQTLGLSLTVQEDGEESLLYIFQSSDVNATPRIWAIVGQDSAGNIIDETAAWILDRQGGPGPNGVFKSTPAPGIDRGWPFGPNDKLTMNFATMYGIAQFFWSK